MIVPFALEAAKESASFFEVVFHPVIIGGGSITGLALFFNYSYRWCRDRIWNLMGYKYTQFHSEERPQDAHALAHFIIQNLPQRYEPNLSQFRFNLTGTNEEYWFLAKNATLRVGDISITLLDGTSPDNFFYELWTKDHKKFSNLIGQNYFNLFYAEEELSIVPQYNFSSGWRFHPHLFRNEIYPSLNENTLNSLRLYIETNKRKGILLEGVDGQTTAFLVDQIGKTLQRRIYLANNELSGLDFLASAKDVLSKSILWISEIPRIFERGNPNLLLPDMLITLFDHLPADVLVVLTAYRGERLHEVEGLFVPGRVERIFNNFHL